MRRKAIMPWKDSTTMSTRSEFIERAKEEGTNISALCRELGISRKTGYKWLKRQEGKEGGELGDRSRRPKNSPSKTDGDMETAILKVREEHPAWGGRKIKQVLKNRKMEGVPAASTITAILWRNARIDPAEAAKHKPWQRFEREQPNELWQMDFKGYFALTSGGYCHPLTVIDDHSRFLLGLKACPNETYLTVQAQLTAIFEQFGLPERMLMDNGSPWGDDRDSPYTILSTWLLRLDIGISHGRPYHPQTQGKDERFNRTLLNEVISRQALPTLPDSQAAFDQWAQVYNYIRPHEALQLDTPASHYHSSPRPFPALLPPVIYDLNDLIRKVDENGKISFHNRSFRVGKAFRHQPVALRPTPTDGLFDVFFSRQQVAQINLLKDNC
jgi:transposase InsO family protein